MRTNIDVDDELLAEAMKALGTRTKKETVEAGLREVVRQYRTRQVLELRGAVRWEGDLDEMRSGRPGWTA
ncbi:type II toxin-antitoxin system VapB family antitoxin [Pseudonocardia nigra]|uniref:type II toxin-antitoxin system VapB family antitoxin n=1 Tax=Pseudonocardia nigra TaxID=1921578 RepID=UPI001C5FC3B2|nr:type II toxin-antitoxin system VapB family antitoxin [Pseudonocardia nigra]